LATVNIDSKLLEALKQSTCFGIAHDEEVPECRQCDVKGQCKAKSEGVMNIPTPTVKPKKAVSETKSEPKPKATTPKKPTTTTKSATPVSKPSTTAQKHAPKTTQPSGGGNAPDFKPMGLDELKALAEQRNVEWKDYGNDNITRMRLIMALKKSY
jgi:hypothetical protein